MKIFKDIFYGIRNYIKNRRIRTILKQEYGKYAAKIYFDCFDRGLDTKIIKTRRGITVEATGKNLDKICENSESSIVTRSDQPNLPLVSVYNDTVTWYNAESGSKHYYGNMQPLKQIKKYLPIVPREHW